MDSTAPPSIDRTRNISVRMAGGVPASRCSSYANSSALHPCDRESNSARISARRSVNGTRLPSVNTAAGLSPSSSSDETATLGWRTLCRDARTEDEAPREAPPSGVLSIDSATRTAHRTIRSVSALIVSRGPDTSSTPSNRPVAGSVMGAAVQAQSWWVRTRCSAENS
ncbi:hypothetical protein [Pseudarthrobacter oxydans]|uniref:hypothetical protein n=1 Tax=Pseudarthrobacter oxydans TaxID=1671 RepID=UPI002AA80C51|nr:hypothetical protein [Pseudarthrobacter oxydans]WPU11488.1 hypothetical protein SMD14_05195 [Pseudarthrobacter oxydans]